MDGTEAVENVQAETEATALECTDTSARGSWGTAGGQRIHRTRTVNKAVGQLFFTVSHRERTVILVKELKWH